MKEDTRKMILNASLELAGRYGFWSFRVEDILRYAHVSRATFYKYFKNRQDVLFALLDDRMETIESDIRAAVCQESQSYDRLSIFMEREISGMKDLFATLNIRIGQTDISPVIPIERMDKKNEKDLIIIRDILLDGKRRGDLVFEDLELTARAVMGMTREIGFRAIPENKDQQTVRREIDVMLKTLFFGISNEARR